MPAPARAIAITLLAAAAAAISAGCNPSPPAGALMAQAPDGRRLAVAATGGRSVRVLHVSGPSIVRLREVFVPEGQAIAAIAWSDDGRELIVSTRGPVLAIDTRTWRVETGAVH